MSDKDNGIEFDRQAFVPPPEPAASSGPLLIKALLALAGFACVAFLGYQLISHMSQASANSADPALANLDIRLAAIEGRLEKLETRKGSLSAKKEDAETKEDAVKPAVPAADSSKPAVKTVYHVAFAQSGLNPPPAAPAETDPATAKRVSALQQGLGALESNQAENRDAWQATTDRLADVAGQVGSQGTEIVKSKEELDRLLARTDKEAIPFELLRGSNPQVVGPVSLVLKASNPKKQSYTLCVYTQPACIELRDRSLHEVVQFVMARNTSPLEVIATKITKDQMLGYLEVPRGGAGTH